MHDQLHRHIIYDLVICLNIRVFLADIIEDIAEHSICHFHDICLMNAGHFLTVMAYCIVESSADDTLTASSGNDLNRMNRILIDHLFYACIQILCVFTEDNDIYIFKCSFYGRVCLCRTDICVKIIFLS